jgi:quinoprotein glucose dehydrogenase
LISIEKSIFKESIQKIILSGKGIMPFLPHLSETERQTIIDFLLNKIPPGKTDTTGKPDPFFQHMGYIRWYDRAAYPMSRPTWDTLTAMNLNTGVHLWQVPLGEYKELPARVIALCRHRHLWRATGYYQRVDFYFRQLG